MHNLPLQSPEDFRFALVKPVSGRFHFGIVPIKSPKKIVRL